MPPTQGHCIRQKDIAQEPFFAWDIRTYGAMKMEGSGEGHKSDYQNKLHVALKLHEFLRWTDLAVESN